MNEGLQEAFEDVIEQTYKIKFLNKMGGPPQDQTNQRRVTLDGKKPPVEGGTGGHKKKCC